MLNRNVKANRMNATMSTGPRTWEGKQRVSWNALRHGLTGKRVVVPEESAEEFEALRDAVIEDLRPRGPVEMVIAERVAAGAWRMRRAVRVEGEMMEGVLRRERQMHNGPFDDLRLASLGEALVSEFGRGRAFENLRRYEVQIERSFYRGLKSLVWMRAVKRQAVKEAIVNELRRRMLRKNGFVSQKGGNAARGPGGKKGPGQEGAGGGQTPPAGGEDVKAGEGGSSPPKAGGQGDSPRGQDVKAGKGGNSPRGQDGKKGTEPERDERGRTPPPGGQDVKAGREGDSPRGQEVKKEPGREGGDGSEAQGPQGTRGHEEERPREPVQAGGASGGSGAQKEGRRGRSEEVLDGG